MLNVNLRCFATATAITLLAALSSNSFAQIPTGGPLAENPVWYHWIAGYPTNYVYITDDTTYPLVTPSTVPVVDTNTPLAWENSTYWMDMNDAATLTFPPNSTASWFIGSDGNPTTNDPSVTVLFTQDRDGNNGTKKVGGFALGGGNAAQIQTLKISANMTITGVESTTNDELTASPNRGVRIGRNDEVFDNQIPWGVVQQTHGLVFLECTNNGATGVQGDLRILSDKDWISGGIWEVGGDARLRMNDALQLGDRTAAGITKGHGIFRVRGSAVQEVKVGAASLSTGDYITFSGPGRGDSQLVDYSGNLFTKVNGGKAITEFVLDQNGVAPIEVFDELRLGTNAQASFIGGEPNPVLYAFLRVKLAAPTTKGSGAVGSDDDIVLFRADRITTAVTALGGSQLEQGRFMDPDRDLPTFPHRPLLEGGSVIANYAGATYTWTINYFEGSGGSDDNLIDDTVTLSNLVVTGSPGDLDGNTMVNASDRALLQAAIAAPPVSHHDLLGAAQHLFDLNADDFIDSLDLAAFNTYFLAPVGLAGDFNNDGHVDAEDYTVWRDNLGAPTDASLNGNGDAVAGVGPGDYTLWKNSFGNPGAGAGGFGTGPVPEPGTALLATLALFGLVCVRTRPNKMA